MKKQVDYESEVKEALEFLNGARQAPASIIPELVKMMGKFKGNNYMIEPNVQLQTNEGVKAVEDAITFLSKQKSVKPYQIGTHHTLTTLYYFLFYSVSDLPKPNTVKWEFL